ncbi:sugar kinase [Sphingobacterium siyangense]|uniref:2-dehydro-3-deoxygluconokinase n=1 Tax=Sphingobacterium siyangense TaxID=459529 RepID=A0A562MDD9_9SPHI|nr:sugar kinase [Sphingobacterium siyangense]TWI17913.1 2-dehydro-3-deoxygluconokinase [Sphingobacterium siyangense]
MQGKVLSFGELLLRICPDIEQDWIEQHQLPFYVGGAELNVATALALWNVPSSYLSAIPQNAICEGIDSYLKRRNIDTSVMQWTGERLGIYYLPKGKDLKNAGVIYDRANSSFANLKVGSINWEEIFADVKWFHFSAICPAISQDIADLCLEAVKKAQEKAIFVSLDLNYRAKLWKYGKTPKEIMPEIAKYCNLIMGNIWAAHQMLGTQLDDKFLTSSSGYQEEDLLAQADRTSKEIISVNPICQYVANTFRFDYQSKGIKYYTTLFDKDSLIKSTEYTAEEILDKVGSGDCFMAGLIYGLYSNLSPQETLAFATLAAFDKLFIASDATTSTVEDIKNRMIA